MGLFNFILVNFQNIKDFYTLLNELSTKISDVNSTIITKRELPQTGYLNKVVPFFLIENSDIFLI